MLVLITNVAYLMWFFQFLYIGSFITPTTWTILSWHGYGALLRMPDRLDWLFTFLTIIVAIGLWSFSRSARIVYTWTILFSFVMTFFAGVEVQTAFGSSLLLVCNLADGAILVMAYTQPLKTRFESPEGAA